MAKVLHLDDKEEPLNKAAHLLSEGLGGVPIELDSKQVINLKTPVSVEEAKKYDAVIVDVNWGGNSLEKPNGLTFARNLRVEQKYAGPIIIYSSNTPASLEAIVDNMFEDKSLNLRFCEKVMEDDQLYGILQEELKKHSVSAGGSRAPVITPNNFRGIKERRIG